MTRNRGNKPNTKFEKLLFAGKYSMKNIPVPTNNTEYMKKLIAQMEKIIKRMRWKALFFLKNEEKYKPLVEDIEFHEKEDTYRFNSTRKPLPIKEIEQFEKDCYDIIKNIQFCDIEVKHGQFQKEMRKDLNKMKKCKNVIIQANKSSNFYTCDVPSYRDLR